MKTLIERLPFRRWRHRALLLAGVFLAGVVGARPVAGQEVVGAQSAASPANRSKTPQVLPAAPATSPPTSPPTSPELEAMMVPYRLGHYDECIAKANQMLAKAEKPDPHMVYWRGYAERRVGWLEAAEKDFASLGDFSAWPGYPSATKLSADMKALLELRPPLEEVVRVGDEVAFRVYYSRNDDFTRNVIAALPRSYGAASTFLEKQLHEIPVFVFNDTEYGRFFRFFSLLDCPPHVWWRVLSTSGTITISQKSGSGSVIPQDVTTLPQTIAHELTHVFMTRILGKIKDFPNWFNEGSANLVAASLDPEALRRNDQKIQRLRRIGAILPLDQLTSHSAFDEAVDQLTAGTQKGDPYAQGLSMTRYLGMALKGMKLSDFWVLMEQKQDFAEAVKEGTGLTVPEFYAAWLKAIQN